MRRNSKPRLLAAPSHIPFHASLETPLITFGGQPWRIRDANEGLGIFGGPGSAKTSASGGTFLDAFCAAGMGGLFLSAKPDAADEIRRAAAATGRTAHLKYINATEQSERINLFDAVHALGGEGFEQGEIEFLGRMAEAHRNATNTGGGSDGENRYFVDNALKMASHALPMLRAARGTVAMDDLYKFITSVPATAADAVSEDWKSSFCYQVHARLDELRKLATGRELARLMRVIEEHGDFFVGEVANLDSRPKTSTISTLTNMLYPFQTGKLRELFCTTTTFSLRELRDGAILVLDLSTIRYGATSIVVQILLKYLAGLVLQSEKATETTRPVFIFADEAQWFLASSDADLLATARSAKICVCYITQDIPTVYAKLERDAADSLLSKYGTMLFHASGSHPTNLAAAEKIGKVEKFHVTETRSRGATSGAGGNRHDESGGFHGNHGANISVGKSTSGFMDFEVPPEHFATKLRTGAKANDYKADAIVIRTAKKFKSTGRHWCQAEFSQKRGKL